MKKYLTATLIMLMLVGCNVQTEAPTVDNKQNACDMECERVERGSTKDLIQDMVPVLSLDESIEFLDKTGVLFYSFDSCPWCYDALPVLLEEFKLHSIPVYYVDLKKEDRSEDNPSYVKLLEKVKDEVDGKVFVPFALFLNEGKIVGSHTGTTNDHVIVDGNLPAISEKQKLELGEIYETLFKKLETEAHITAGND